MHQASEDRIAAGVKKTGIEIEALWPTSALKQLFSAREGFVADEGLSWALGTEQEQCAARAASTRGTTQGAGVASDWSHPPGVRMASMSASAGARSTG